MIEPAYNAGLYLRLSRDDEVQGDSLSIVTQRNMLRKYAKDHNITVYDEYVDDGWSGTNFNRPDFLRMIQDIEANKINCVIVKDLSRFGRNYILTGQYIELYFPSHNVRFIAINDGIDSINGDDEFAPFKNIINEWYARDISKKIHAALQIKFEMGERYSAYAPIGYKKHPENPGKLIIDEETRWIVEKIFDYASQGMGPIRIMKSFIQEKVPTPAWINYQKSGAFARVFDGQPEEKRYMWTVAQIRHILKDETYIGNTIHNRRCAISFKNKKRIRKPESEWLKIENTHEPIIDNDDFVKVQDMMKSRRRKTKSDQVQIFSGLIKCADCGWSLRFCTNNQNKNPYHYFACTRHAQLGKTFCSMHYIRYDALYEYVLSRIRHWATIAREDEDKLLEHLIKSGNKESVYLKNKTISDIKKSEKRLKELDMLFTNLYEDRMHGKINERNFNTMILTYQKEQDELRELMEVLSVKLNETKTDEDSKKQWVDLIKQYTDPQELTAPLLNALIEKILVHEAVETEQGKEQEIEIFYRFIGKID